MKKYLFSLIFVLVSFVGFSQKGLSYQAVILDPAKIEIPGQDISSQPLVNGDVWLKFSIFNGSTLQFEEVHKTKTDNYGLVNLLIGSVSSASFNSLVWDGSQKSLQVFVSFNQGGSYTKISDQKLNYNPYALFAETAGKLGGTLAISGGGTGATTAADARANLGLDQVNNTSDVAKPVSTATKAALDLKANASDVTTALALKANTADMSAALAVKVDTTYVLAKVAAATIVDADATTKGKIQLAGDLGGTAAAPTVPGLALKANTIDVNAALDLKANTVDMTNALASKANGATVATSLNLKENAANKSLNVSADGSSDTKYPSVKAVKDYVDARVQSGGGSSTITDADASTKGKIQLAGDLGGTADAPTVPGLALKANAADVTTALALKANALDFTTLTNRVNTNTQSITSNASAIVTLNTNVASNTSSITANATAIATEAARATAAELILTNNVSSNTSSITSNNASINLKAPLESPTFTGTVTTGAINSGAMSATSVNTPIYASTPQTLTDAATIIWNPANGLNASVTLGGNRTLSFSSTLAAGSYGTLVITQDVTGGRTITLPSTTNKVLGSNSTTSIALSEVSGATDILNFYYDGTNCFWNIGQGYGINGTTNLSSSVSGKLPVANGGTGANTLTGIVKGNGTSALTAAIAGTDFQAPIALTTTGTGSATLSGTTLNIPLVSSTVNTSTLSGTVALTNGGTGQTTILGIRNALGLSGNGVTIGQQNSGQTNQASDAISIGAAAGNSDQGIQSVAIGYVAGSSGQGANSVSIGGGAGQVSQGANSIAIGFAAGQVSQGTNSIAIGKNSVASANSIALGNSATTGTYSNSTSIGNGAISTADNTIQLGNTTVSNVKTSGTLTAGTVTYPNAHNLTPGQVLTINATGSASWTTPASSGGGTHVLGEQFGGGTVYYINSNGTHGLIAENADLGISRPFTMDGVNSNGTMWMVGARYQSKNPLAHTTEGKEFFDWEIPEIYELHYLYQAINSGNSVFNTLKLTFGTKSYWSNSFEQSYTQSFMMQFSDGAVSNMGDRQLYNVRCIRRF
ncbi:beta strand repeat-containing protein [Aquirufa lenticrescens]